jgi:hypothetical protein
MFYIDYNFALFVYLNRSYNADEIVYDCSLVIAFYSYMVVNGLLKR